jgi:hypothetical protein
LSLLVIASAFELVTLVLGGISELRNFVAFSSQMATEYRNKVLSEKTSPTNNDRIANLGD